jgi:hypothetical protein
MISPAEIQQILNNDSYSSSSIKLRCNFLRRFHRFTLDSTEIRCKKTSSISASFWRRDCGGGLLVKRPVEQLPPVHAGEQSNVSLRQLCSTHVAPFVLSVPNPSVQSGWGQNRGASRHSDGPSRRPLLSETSRQCPDPVAGERDARRGRLDPSSDEQAGVILRR